MLKRIDLNKNEVTILRNLLARENNTARNILDHEGISESSVNEVRNYISDLTILRLKLVAK